MTKTLKIAMAMGGGVSLGSFSGAALTESLKLLLLYGTDECGNKYDGIELDAMSGASAGAMSLSILLRALLDYDSLLVKLGKNKAHIESALIGLYGPNVMGSSTNPISNAKLEQLIALQVAQELQEKIWVDELDLERLLLKDEAKEKNSFSLLETKHMKHIIHNYITYGVENNSFENIQVVNKNRFLFACSLSNLSPIKSHHVMKRFGKTDSKPVLVNRLLQSVSSFNHKEVRVIDFIFNSKNVKYTDSRWIKFYDEQSIDSKMLKEIKDEKGNFRINTNEAWNVLSASVLACGAFPMAFEPVLLKRYKSEFSNNWPDKFNKLTKDIKDRVTTVNSYIDKGQTEKNKMDYESFNFPYVDGGTFNNEPLKEAFKMASFIDYHDEENKDDFDRMVLFVDPIVRTADPKFQLTAFSPVKTKVKDGEVSYEVNSEIPQAMSLTSSLINMLQQQGSVKEEHKVDNYVENVQLTSKMTNYLLGSTIKYGNRSDAVIYKAYIKIEKFLLAKQIPVGTRNIEDYLYHKIKVLIKKNKDLIDIFKCLKNVGEVEFKSFIKSINQALKEVVETQNHDEQQCIDAISKCFEDSVLKKNFTTIANIDCLKSDLLQLFFISLTDITLDTDGKDDTAVRVAITPFEMDIISNSDVKKYNEEKVKNGSEEEPSDYNKTVRLPGVDIAAFAGFASLASRKYAFEYGRLCAMVTLQRRDFRQYYNEVINWNDRGCDSKPFIDEAKAFELINKTKKEIISKNFYENYARYADQVSTKIYNKGINRILQMVYLSAKKKVLYILRGTLIGLTSFITIPNYKYFLKQLLKRENLKSKFRKSIFTKQLKPITIKIKVSGDARIQIKYRDGETKKINPFAGKLMNGSKNIYFQLFMDVLSKKDLKSNDDKIRLFTNPTRHKIDMQGSDPNWGNVKMKFEPTDEVIEVKLIWSKYFGMSSSSNPYNILTEVNNPKKSMYWSLMNSEYHINPTLEIDLTDMTNESPSIVFMEDTKAMSLEL